MKRDQISLDQLAAPKKVAPKKTARSPRKHWSEDFLKHLDAWGRELRKASPSRKAGA
jgi:hypothetical protein